MAIDKYNIARFDRTDKSGKHWGRGVMFYIKNDIKCAHLPEYDFCGTFLECIWVRLDLTNVEPIYYGLCYRPPQGSIPFFLDKLEWICLEL